MIATLEDNTESREEDCDGEPPRAFQVQSYAHLLKFPPIPINGKNAASCTRSFTAPVDAIIVPTIRSAEQINSAAELASNAGCQLVVLYTDGFPAGLSSLFGRYRREATTVLALPRNMKHHLLDLAAGLPNSRVSSCALDISRKRNLGLLLGRACGWTRVLFLDDDIRRLNISKLSSAATLLDEYPIVGLQVRKYPDASVVGHARRLAGRRQEPFISGGSLLVDPQRVNGFFPPVYHEDWLCIINHLRRGQVAVGGAVGQLPYKPFTTPERAELEEFGDILVSGLLWLVHERHGKIAPGGSPETDHDYWSAATQPAFWRETLIERARLLRELIARFERLAVPESSPLPSLDAARRRCGQLTPGEFVSFTTKWLENLGHWRERLSWLPRADSVGKALSELGLSGLVRPYEERPAAVRAARRPGGFAGHWGRRASAGGRSRFGFRTW